MPYDTNASLPGNVTSSLPDAAQSIWRGAFNGAFASTCRGDEACAIRVAWSAVKKVYRKTEDGWVKKGLDEAVGKLDHAVARGFLDPDELPFSKAAIRQGWPEAAARDSVAYAKSPRVTLVGQGVLIEYRDDALVVSKMHATSEPGALHEGQHIFAVRKAGGTHVRVGGKQIVLLDSDQRPGWAEAADLVLGPGLTGRGTVDLTRTESGTVFQSEPLSIEIGTSWDYAVATDAVAIGTDAAVPATATPVRKYSYAVSKQHEESRYTLGPMYVPHRLDAHSEFTDDIELQQAVWWYVQNSSRAINLQHQPDILAGEWVEIMVWPYEVTTELQLPGRGLVKQTFPANTAFMGVLWEPWSWSKVKKGELRGLSIEGEARKIEAEFDGPDDYTTPIRLLPYR